IPDAIKGLFFGPLLESAPVWLDVLNVCAAFVRYLFFFILVVCIVAYPMTRTARRVGPAFIATWMGIVSIVVGCAAIKMIPKVVAGAPKTMGIISYSSMPDMSLQLCRFALLLEPDDTQAYTMLASIQTRLNQVEDAIETEKKEEESKRDKDKKD